MNDVIEIAGFALPHDEVAGLEFYRLETGEDALDIGRRHPREQRGLQHARHPVIALFGIDFADADVLRVAAAFKCDQLVEQVAFQAQDADLRRQGTGCQLAGLQLSKTVHGVWCPAVHRLHELLASVKLHLAFEQVERVTVPVTFPEHVLTAPEVQHLGAREQLLPALHRQLVQRHEHVDHAGKFFVDRRHRAHR